MKPKFYDRLFEEADETPDGSGGGEGEEVEESAADGSEESSGDESTDGDGAESDDEPETDGMTADELKEAKALYGLLKNKETQKDTLRVLAQQAGILQNVETKADLKEAKKSLKEIIKPILGKDFEFFGDKLSEALEAVLEQERQTNKAELSKLQLVETERQTTAALDRLAKTTKGDSTRYEQSIIKLMDKYTPSPGTSIYDYLKDLYNIASADKRTASTKAQIADKIRRNSNDAAGRLQTTRSTGKEGTSAGPAKPGLRAAVEYAMKQLEKGK